MAKMASSMADEGDWGSLPLPLLSRIFRTVLEQTDTVESIVSCYANLVSVNTHWNTAGRLTPLCFHLTEQKHLSGAALKWLAKQTLEVIIIDRNQAAMQEELLVHESISFLHSRPFIITLLAEESTQRNSKDSLVSLVNIPAKAAPFLAPFSYLRQVSLYNPNVANQYERIPMSALSDLPRLSCLTIAGYFSDEIDWASLPPTLRHLSISKYTLPTLHSAQEEVFRIFLPPLSQIKLQYFSLKADYLAADWGDLVTRCEEVHLSANYLALAVGGDDIHPQVDLHTSRFAHLVASAQRMNIAVLAFHMLYFFQGEPQIPVNFDIDTDYVRVDEMLDALRKETLSTWDIDPVMDVPQNFVNDVEPRDGERFVLTMDKQDGPEPRSYHFTTPMSDIEVHQMIVHPAWRLVWCVDPRTKIILENAAFVRANAQTLVRLSRCTLPERLDLRPYTSLRSLHASVLGNPDTLRLPTGLTSIDFEPCVHTANMLEPEDILSWVPRKHRYNATGLSSLTKLKDLCLTGWMRHDLTALPPSVTSLRLVNPKNSIVIGNAVVPGEMFTVGPENLRLPPHLAPNDPRKLSTRGVTTSLALLVGSLLGVAPGRMAWSDDEDENGATLSQSAALAAADAAGIQYTLNTGDDQRPEMQESLEMSLLALGSVSPSPAGPSQEGEGGGSQATQPGGTEGSQEQRPSQSQSGRRRRRKRVHVEDGYDDATPLPEHEEALFFAMYEDEDESDLLASSEHAGAGAHACDDPLCPVHSGKPHLQLNFNDYRDEVAVDLLFLVSTGFPMISITIDPPEFIEHSVSVRLNVGPSWPAFLKALETSRVQVLEINHHRQQVNFMKDPPSTAKHHGMWQGLQEMEKKLGSVFVFRSWDGITSRDGLHEDGECFALVRRDSLLINT